MKWLYQHYFFSSYFFCYFWENEYSRNRKKRWKGAILEFVQKCSSKNSAASPHPGISKIKISQIIWELSHQFIFAKLDRNMQQDQIYRLSRKNLLEFNSSENISIVNSRDPRTEKLDRADQAILTVREALVNNLVMIMAKVRAWIYNPLK